jgi:adenylyl cyclase-associated protein
MIDAAQFYTNRVIKDNKDTDTNSVEWAKTWVTVLQEVHDYVKRNHTTGLVWNPKGGDATAPAASAAAPAAAAPKPAAPAAAAPAAAAEGAKPVREGLFAELGKGTTGLKHVDKSQMTHKNPELRASSVVAANAIPVSAATSAAAPKAAEVAKTPVFELQGKKWVVEHQKGNKEIVISKTEIKQAVYIYKCHDSTIQIKGKVNTITLDNCTKTAVVFDDVVASIDLVNCKSIQVQILNTVPLVSIDKTDGAQVYLSKASLNAHIVTAKSSEMNVMIPSGADGDYTEIPVPEQFKTVWNGTKLVTEVNDIAG